MNRNTGMHAGQIIGTMNGIQVVGLDIAKQVFQMHTVNMGTGEIINVQIKRTKVLDTLPTSHPAWWPLRPVVMHTIGLAN